MPERAGTPVPLPLTSFVGREREVASVVALVSQDNIRAVTLTGPGGVGKTRLALQVATRLAAGVRDGVWFVDLATIADPALVPATLASALGVREGGDRSVLSRLTTALGDRQALLILDNVEHVLAGLAPLANLLMTCPGVTLLATSRVRLGISGEHVVAVPPLALPGSDAGREITDAEAVRLFADRAQAAWADFAVTEANAGAVADICRTLDGLPLAIELAAARVAYLSPAELLVRLSARLPELVGGPHDVPPRLRTMRDAIAWSCNLLTPDVQRVFRRLAVFVGGFDLEAAQAVIDDDLFEELAALVDASLVHRWGGPDEEPRFAILETIRELAWEQLLAAGENQPLCERHAVWCLTLAERGFTALVLSQSVEPRWLDRLEAERGNLRAAFTWFAEHGDWVSAMRLAGALGPFWFFRSRLIEGKLLLERALAGATSVPPEVRACALVSLGVLLQVSGEPARAAAFVTKGMELWETAGDVLLTTQAKVILGWMAVRAGENDRAAALLDDASRRFRDLGANWWIAKAVFHRAEAALGQGSADGATAGFAVALDLYQALGDQWGIASCQQGLGVVACDEGDAAAAAGLYQESLVAWQAVGTMEGVATWVAAVAALAGACNDPEQAVRLFGAAAAVCEELGVTFGLPYRARFSRAEAEARARIEDGLCAEAQAVGRAMSIHQAVAEACGALAAIEHLPPLHRGSGTDLGLTRREHEVLRLIVTGSTDREIATALSISPRTVGVHVSHLLSKLGVETRRAARARAIRDNLLS